MTVQNIHFQAKWNTINSHLQTPIPSTMQKVRHVGWNILSVIIPVIGLGRLAGYAVGSLINRFTLPAARYMKPERIAQRDQSFVVFWKGVITDKNEAARAVFTAEEHTIITPDGAQLDVKLLRHKDANALTPTVICFNGNFELALENLNPWFMQQAIENAIPCNFVCFDYRGVGHSKGSFTAPKDLIVDGSSVEQWVIDYLKTPLDRMHFYGKSLGGAVAVQTQALDPQHLVGRHLNERSFASLEAMIHSIFGFGWMSKVLIWICINQGYSADAATAFKKLQGQKLIVYHPEDRIIPYSASLQNAVQHNAVICLEPKPLYTEQSKKQHHNAPLEWHVGATEQMTQFLFGIAATETQVV